eukprot:TRINITY_DN3820_c0_g1_i1.p1 TRINITY_DN3820_c0_g1~~TRINITY_DN3820_c0_g1_i1.p1  ORF type:complete len:200 (-),score=35.86 TRINITY_DN3820_c0_g1_i1:51-593(-)
MNTSLSGGNLLIEFAKEADLDQILELVNHENLLLPVSRDTIQDWIVSNCSLIARDAKTNRVVAHQAISLCNRVARFRSAVVAPGYRRQGINTHMKKLLIDYFRVQLPGVAFVAVTHRDSHSIEILKKLGFKEAAMKEIPEIFKTQPHSSSCVSAKQGMECVCKFWLLQTTYEDGTKCVLR